jgi:ParB/RepB/Spo0J family partition protein
MSENIETAYLNITLEEVHETYGRLRLVNPRADANMMESMRRFGQLTPATVSRTGENRYEMVDGFKRLRACRHLGVEFIRAGVLEGHGRVLKTAMVQLNRKGNSIRDIEEALVVQSLHREDQLDQVEIAALLGRDKSWVCRRVALVEKLAEDVLENMRLGLLTAAHGRELVRLPRGNQKETLECVLKHRLSSRETRRLVSALIERPRCEHDQLLWLPLEILDDRLAPRTPKEKDPAIPPFEIAMSRLEKSCNITIRGFDQGLFESAPKQPLSVTQLVEATLERLKRLAAEEPF